MKEENDYLKIEVYINGEKIIYYLDEQSYLDEREFYKDLEYKFKKLK